MLPLADHLEMALEHVSSQFGGSVATISGVDEAFVGNIRATLSASMTTLQRYGVEPISAFEQPFDPAIHEAVGQTSSKTIPADHVVEVIQTGYRDGEKLLRPARVIVSSG